MNVYSIEVKICATAYIKAESGRQAIEIAMSRFGENTGSELTPGRNGGMPVSGRRYDDPLLPDVSLSPAISFYGTWDGALEPELVVEDVTSGTGFAPAGS